jgi:hypothetical protein
MRSLLPLLLLSLAIAGCATDDIRETGISRRAAITIAERHCVQYPARFRYVDHAGWNPDGHFWLVALTDYNGDHGRAYKIGPGGGVLDSHVIDRVADDQEYGYGGRHYGVGWYYW